MCIEEFPEVCLLRINSFLEPLEEEFFKCIHYLISEPIQYLIDDRIYRSRYPLRGLEAKADTVWMSAKELYCASNQIRNHIRKKLDTVCKQIGFDKVVFDHRKDYAAFHYYGIN